MIMSDTRIKELLPEHYQDSAPRFIQFLDKYYEWLYRSSGMSDSEIADLKNDTSWIERDIDKFIATGQMKYIDQTSDSTVLDSSLVVLNNTANPGGTSASISNNYMLDDDFKGYLTSDGQVFQDTNDVSVELSTVENKVLDSWFNSMGLDRIKRYRMDALDNIDQVLMLSLLKHIYAIKGTEASMKLFFRLYFNEEVTVYQPKSQISVIDDNWILDDVQVIRDDELFQEFSYVIIVNNELDSYKDIFRLIYMKTIHPSGFRVALVKSVDYTNGKINSNAEFMLG